MLTRPRRGALLAVLLLLAALPLLVAARPGSQHLTVLGCGATITTNTTLAADIGPCLGDGVDIDADHVTLNLNGHQISGDGANGVFSQNAGVTVENGRVTGFETGVFMAGDASRVVNMRVTGVSGPGIDAEGQKDLVSGNRTFANVGTGIVGHGAGSQYTNNVLQGNDVDGLDVTGAASISGNKALSNLQHGIAVSATLPVAVTNNVANGNHGSGISEAGEPDPTLAMLSGNKVYFNGQLGISALAGATDGGNNKADKNGTSAQCTNVVCS